MCNLRHNNENRGQYEEYCYKAIRSGKHTEVYIYYDKIFRRKTRYADDLLKMIESWDITVNKKEILKEEKKEVEQEILEEFVHVNKNDLNLKRSQRRLKRLINSNLGQYKELDKFLTLTYPGLKSREKACRAFKTFAQNLRRNYGSQIQYIAVMEIQDGSRLEDSSLATKDIHFHVLLFDCPYIPQAIIQDRLWGHGIVDIRKIEQFGDIAGYLANYLSKDQTLAIKGKRSYFPSRKLKKPIEQISMDDNLLVEILKNEKNEVQFSTEFIIERVGRIGYIKLIENEKEDEEKTMTFIN